MAYITTNEVKEIRKELKNKFPNLKFSVRREHYSNVKVILKSGDISFADILNEKRIYNVNQYNLESEPQKYKDLFKKIIKIIRNAPAYAENGRAWYDKSDAMTDYFDTAFYYDFNIGEFGKPYLFKN